MKDKPNILLILGEQYRPDVIGAYGSEVCRTPGLDRLAAEGVRFDDAFTPQALCGPARASLFTGRLPHQHGLLDNPGRLKSMDIDALPDSETTLAEMLAPHGYRCGYCGKWGMGKDSEPQHGFTEWKTGGYGEYVRKKGCPPPPKHSVLWPDADTFYGTSPQAEEDHITAFLGRRAVSLMDKLTRSGDPWFICSASPIHWPFVVPSPYDTMYDPSQVPKPPNFDDPMTDKPSSHSSTKGRKLGQRLGPWPEWQKFIAHYWGSCTLTDKWLVGMALDKLDELGIADNTIVIFTSDHCTQNGSHGILSIGPMFYEESIRVPLIIRWPARLVSGESRRGIVNHIDLVPTILEMLGLETPENIEGRSFAPLLYGQTGTWDNIYVGEYYAFEGTLDRTRCLRTERWKYCYHVDDLDELYDLASDPWEMTNLAALDDPPDELDEMRAQLTEIMRSNGDPLPPPT